MQERMSSSPLTLDVQFLPGGGQMEGQEMGCSLEQRRAQGHTQTQMLLQKTALET